MLSNVLTEFYRILVSNLEIGSSALLTALRFVCSCSQCFRGKFTYNVATHQGNNIKNLLSL